MTNTAGRVTVNLGAATTIGCAAVSPGKLVGVVHEALYAARSVGSNRVGLANLVVGDGGEVEMDTVTQT